MTNGNEAAPRQIAEKILKSISPQEQLYNYEQELFEIRQDVQKVLGFMNYVLKQQDPQSKEMSEEQFVYLIQAVASTDEDLNKETIDINKRKTLQGLGSVLFGGTISGALGHAAGVIKSSDPKLSQEQKKKIIDESAINAFAITTSASMVAYIMLLKKYLDQSEIDLEKNKKTISEFKQIFSNVCRELKIEQDNFIKSCASIPHIIKNIEELKLKIADTKSS